MATPVSYTHHCGANSGPSPQELQQLWEKLNGNSASDDRKSLRSSAGTRSRSSSRRHSTSVWVGGSSIAQDARGKLRAADEARRRRVAGNAIDGSSDWSGSALRSGTSQVQIHGATNDERVEQHSDRVHQSPDLVGLSHGYTQHMLEASPLSSTIKLSPAAPRNTGVSSHLQAPALGDIVPSPVSSLVFNNISFDSSSPMSPQTEETLSPTEAPTSAETACTAEAPRTPMSDTARKRASVYDSPLKASTQKRRLATVPNIRSEGYFSMAIDDYHRFVGVNGDNRCLLRNESFVERAPTPRRTPMSTSNALPELSSFRPTNTQSQIPLGSDRSSQRLARVLTAPVGLARPAVTEDPAWMRPMHLVDTGGKSIYMNVHDDGPIRHALCLWCFRTHGGFRKVHRHGYESCGRTEVLDSHYWEDDAWPDSSDDSPSSGC
ncbi:hypothetical protein SVAN01_10524 [Stagonosporopsis vannaccii]|nr:hypothetical protein SVAN01_10524 [Stagonosporopsis vannaccii]